MLERRLDLKVLAVDDNFFNIQVLSELLRNFDTIDTTTAYSGVEALTIVDDLMR